MGLNGFIHALMFLVLSNLLWATNNIVGRRLSASLDPFTITALRWVLAILLYPVVLGYGVIFRSLYYVSWRSFLLGLIGFTLFNFVLYASLSLAPASLVSLAYGFTPIVIILLSVALGV